MEGMPEMRFDAHGPVDVDRVLPALLAASPLAIVVIEPDTTVRLWNRAAERMFQWTESEVLGKPIPFNPKGKLPECLEVREAAVRGEESEIETQRMRRDGSLVDVKLRAAPMRDEQGGIAGVLLLIEDITDGKRVEAERHATELRLRSVLDALPAAAYLCDTDGLITYFNHAAVKVWGREPKLNDPVDRFCGSFKLLSANGERIRHDQCWMAVALQQDKPIENEEIIVEHPDGTRRLVVADVNLFRDESGKTLGAVNVLTDITERKQSEEAAARLAAIVESSDDAIVSKNAYGVIQSWNRGAERIFGYTEEEAVGQPITLVIPPDRLDEEPGILERIRRGEHIDHFESVRQRKDGGLRNVSLTISPIFNAQGQIVGASKIARDITDRKRVAEELARIQVEAAHDARLHEAILASVPDQVYVFDPDHRYTYANDALLATWGKTWEEAIGKTCLELGYDAWHASMHDSEIDQVIATRQPIRGEVPFTGTNGQRVYEYIFVPVIGPDGKVEAVAGTTRDITERREQTAMRIRTEKLAAMGRLASTMAHEINNPLEAVTNLIWLLRGDESLPAQAREYLKTADEELSRVSHLARMTLSFYRGNAKPHRFRVGSLVEDVLTVFASRIRNKSIAIHKKIDPDCEITAIDGELRQAVTNLINNSIDAVATSGKIRISVSAAENAGRKGVKIGVIDDGPGIPESNRSRIFEPFFSTKPETGTGIGLSVTKEIIEKHDGSIRVRSSTKPGQSWTAFSIFLPDEARDEMQRPDNDQYGSEMQ
jgi:PAS domain S-box-containing protein